MDTVTIYISGQCDPNPGPGSWAAALYFQDAQKLKSGNLPIVTNHEAEIRAALGALHALKRPCIVYLHSCSQVFTKIASRLWKTEAHPDLWSEIQRLEEIHAIHWEWTPKTDKRLNEVRHHALNVLMHPEAIE